MLGFVQHNPQFAGSATQHVIVLQLTLRLFAFREVLTLLILILQCSYCPLLTWQMNLVTARLKFYPYGTGMSLLGHSSCTLRSGIEFLPGNVADVPNPPISRQIELFFQSSVLHTCLSRRACTLMELKEADVQGIPRTTQHPSLTRENLHTCGKTLY